MCSGQCRTKKRNLAKSVKGFSLLSTIVGILILGTAGITMSYLVGNLYKEPIYSQKDKQNFSLDSFIAKVRSSQYSLLKAEYDGKTFSKFEDSEFTIKSSVETKGPCSKKNICDYTIVKAELFDSNDKKLDEAYIHRALTHMTLKNAKVFPTDEIVDYELPPNTLSIRFKMWGAGGGGGGANEGYGTDGGAGAFIKGFYETDETHTVQVLIGSAGKTGDSCVTTFNQNRAGIYGTGGNGGGTGKQGCSGAGGAGGGSSWIKIDGTLIALAGGGGGGAGGSNDVPGATIGSTCSTQATSPSLINGETSPVDGGGGGGGGGGYVADGYYGGLGGIYGVDKGRASTAGCYGRSFVINEEDMIIIPPNGRFPASVNDSTRQFSGQGGEGAYGNYAHEVNNPAKNGKIVLNVETETTSAI